MIRRDANATQDLEKPDCKAQADPKQKKNPKSNLQRRSDFPGWAYVDL